MLYFNSTILLYIKTRLFSPLDQHFHYQQFHLGRRYKLIGQGAWIRTWSAYMHGLRKWTDLVPISGPLLRSTWSSASCFTSLLPSCIIWRTRIINPFPYRHFEDSIKQRRENAAHRQTEKQEYDKWQPLLFKNSFYLGIKSSTVTCFLQVLKQLLE